MVVRWSRRASLECLRTKAVVKAKAIKRIKVTAARPWLETGSRSPEALVCLGRCWQACRNPCLKAQCFVRSIQPLSSFFQRLCPNWRMTGVGKACLGRVVNQSHSYAYPYGCGCPQCRGMRFCRSMYMGKRVQRVTPKCLNEVEI